MIQTLTSPRGGSLAIAGGRNAGLEPPASAPHGKEPPGSPPDTPFSAVLDDHQARTAVAEGHQQKQQDASRDAADGDDRGSAIDGDRRDADAATTDPAADGGRDGDRTKPADPTAPETAALAALLGGVPLPAGVKLTAAAIAPVAQGDAEAAVPRAAVALPAGAAAPAPTVPAGPSVPAAATTLPLRPPVPGAPAAEGAPGATPVPGAETPGEQPVESAASIPSAAARATRLADVLQSATARPGVGGATTTAPDATAAATPPAATVAGAAGRSFGQAADQGAANGSAPQQSAPLVSAQPVATTIAQDAASVAASTAPSHGVGLEHAVETVRLALRAAADRGVTHARISLTPRELGSIEVHLRQTADGLVARVVAEHATAAQLLHNAGGELRRQLESQGLTLLRLDIGASGEQGGRAADRQALANAFADGDSSGRNSSGGDAADPLAPLDGTADQTSTTTTLALPNGALVDVLA